MTRLLLDRSTNQLIPYNREDNEPVVGLDRNDAYVVEVVREPEPTDYDQATHYLQALEPVITITDPNGDDVNGTATYGWELIELPPPAPPTPEPDWEQFREALLGENGYATAFSAAAAADPMTATSSAAELGWFQYKGMYQNYLRLLERLLATIAAQQTPEASQDLAGEFLALAQRCHLPADFIRDYAAMMQSAAP
jgi:hypothetical protein